MSSPSTSVAAYVATVVVPSSTLADAVSPSLNTGASFAPVMVIVTVWVVVSLAANEYVSVTSSSASSESVALLSMV